MQVCDYPSFWFYRDIHWIYIAGVLFVYTEILTENKHKVLAERARQWYDYIDRHIIPIYSHSVTCIISIVCTSPMFVIPIFKNIGFMNALIQFQYPYTLITNLQEYKTRGENATPFVSLCHFTGTMQEI